MQPQSPDLGRGEAPGHDDRDLGQGKFLGRRQPQVTIHQLAGGADQERGLEAVFGQGRGHAGHDGLAEFAEGPAVIRQLF